MGVKISDLPEITIPFSGGEKIPVVQSGVTRASNLSSFVNFLSGALLADSELKALSGAWQSNYTTTNSNSANWSSNYTTTNSNSANWSSNYTTTNSNSANWSSNYTTTNSNSANWSSNYTTTNSNSANWSSNYTTTNSNSANWSSVYTTVCATSASWAAGGTNLATVTNYLSTNNVLLSSLTVISNGRVGSFALTGAGDTNANGTYYITNFTNASLGLGSTNDVVYAKNPTDPNSGYRIYRSLGPAAWYIQSTVGTSVYYNTNTLPWEGVWSIVPGRPSPPPTTVSASSGLNVSNNVNIVGSLLVYGDITARSYVNNPTGKTIYVDAATGTDTRTSLSKYDQFKPYATLSAADIASVTGDLVYVRAGTYAINSQIDLNDEGHLYFEPGTTVTIANGVTAFSFNQYTNAFPIANSIRIQGSADFVLTGSAGILTIPASINTLSPPIVAFECNSITGPDAANGTLFNIENGVLSVDAKTIAMTNTFTASNATVFNITGTGDVTTRIPFVYCGRFVNGSGTAFPGNAVRAQINADIWTLITYNATAGMNLRLITTNFRIVNYNHVGVGAAFSWTENTTFESHVFQGVTWSSAIGAAQMTFTSTGGSTTNKRVSLYQTNILRAAATNSLGSTLPIDVYTYGSFATAPAHSNITFKVGAFTVDASA
jgi:hypothetical protein